MTIREHKGWRLLLLCILGAAVLVGHALYGSREKEETSSPETSRGVPVVFSEAALRPFERKISLAGNLEAKNLSLVAPRIGGALDQIFVDEGDVVKAHETKLFQTDSLTLEKALEIARQEHIVSQHAVREKQANLERLQADFAKAEQDYRRGKKLLEQHAISTSAFEEYESRYLQGQALIKHARVLIALSREQEVQAKLGLEIAEKNLEDSLVLAPIDGIVTARFKEPGEMGEVGKPVLQIEDLHTLEASAFLPEEYYGEILPGTTPVRVGVGNLELPLQKISYKSPRVVQDLRTFEIKVLLGNPPSEITPGRMARLEVLLESRTALGVPREALVEKTSGTVLFVAEKEKTARQLEVLPGLETDGWVEIRSTSGDITLEEGTPVITQGQLYVEEGTPLAPVEEGY
ncbi:MAG TPA: efflux RND transporter periplasmic adaptor subunit [Synergistaceae bacterium]|nr:efflux RND transporter periplasmic adaptor subunit [Synergistaceae bacterium]